MPSSRCQKIFQSYRDVQVRLADKRTKPSLVAILVCYFKMLYANVAVFMFNLSSSMNKLTMHLNATTIRS